MWTDSRYYLQIEKELFKCWSMKKLEINEETMTEYILKNLQIKSRIAIDFNLFSKSNHSLNANN